MIKLRIEATPEEIDRFTVYLEMLSRINILNASGNYQNTRGQSKYSRKYIDVELKSTSSIYDELKKLYPLKTKVKPGIDIRRIVYDTYPEDYQNFMLWSFDWSDIDSVLDYLYGKFVASPIPLPQIKNVIELIEKYCETDEE